MNWNKIDASRLGIFFFLGLGWLSLILSIFGIFYAGIIVGFLMAGLGTAIWVMLQKKKNIKLGFSRKFLSLAFIVLVVILVFSYYSSPTIFSGRDQGTLSESAIRLTQNHKMTFSFPASDAFFEIYGPGKALNFPGFYYSDSGELVTKFPLGYISWLAAFYSIFGLNGLVLANAASLLVFLLAFYATTKLLVKNINPLASILLVATSFFLSWFFKFTLSENLGLALTWLGIYQFLLFLKNQDKIFLFGFLLSFGLLIFVRIEAVFLLGLALVIVGLKFRKKSLSTLGRVNIVAIIAMAILYLVSIFWVGEFYRVIGKGILEFFQGTGGQNGGGLSLWQESFYVLNLFSAYALGSFLILGLACACYLIRKKDWFSLVPLFVISPTLFYLIDPNISDDHPWMLRRFSFTVIPLLILYTVILIDRYLKKKIYVRVAFGVLLLSNLFVFFSYLTFIPHKNLLQQIGKISENFEANDLVLVDRLATGDPFSMMSGPLNFMWGKQAAYFFNPEDLEKIDKSKFSRIFLVVPDENLDFYAKSGLLGKLEPKKNYVINNEVLSSKLVEEANVSDQTVMLPLKNTMTIYGKIYLLKN